jgi:hypothetical protein
MFDTNTLDGFLAKYDSRLVGWWFSDYVATRHARKIAIIGEVTCVNPLDSTKSDGRGIDRLQITRTRRATRLVVKQENGRIETDESPKELQQVGYFFR